MTLETNRDWSVAVSFAKTPLSEVSAKAQEITAHGWEYRDRGDPWSASFGKKLPESEADPARELRTIMGEYWVSADEIGALLNPE
jgi:hypothetical protein